VPYVLGLIATRSIDEDVKGLKDLRADSAERIKRGMVAYGELQKLRAGDKSEANVAAFERHKAYTRWVYKVIWGSVTEAKVLQDQHTLY
jgi:cytochrome d ubiquinol oxidase subunit I